MKINQTHYMHNQPKKSRRRLWLMGISGALLLLICSYGVTYFNKDAPKTPSITTPTTSQITLAKNMQLTWPEVGQAAVLNVEDGLLVRSSDNETPQSTASMAKVITALAIMKKQPLKPDQTGPTYTLTAADVATYRAYAAKGGSTLPVYNGMVLTQYQAMQAMLVASSNNIADMLVERVFGSAEAYTAYAQDMLQHMGLGQTVVADASGFSPATVSTPSEMVKLGAAALKDPVIAEIVAQPQAQIPSAGVLKNTNELLGDEGVIGMKTGTTDQAGSCLLFAAHYTAEDGKDATIVGVIMGDANAPSLFSDSRKLLASAKQGFGIASNAGEPASKHRDQMLKE